VPDVFIPLEVNHGEESLDYILKSGIVGHFVFEELDKDRKGFKGLSLESLITKVEAYDLYVKKFKIYLLAAGLEINLDRSKTIVNSYIAAEFARQLLGENLYYQIVLKEDKMLKAILK